MKKIYIMGFGFFFTIILLIIKKKLIKKLDYVKTCGSHDECKIWTSDVDTWLLCCAIFTVCHYSLASGVLLQRNPLEHSH